MNGLKEQDLWKSGKIWEKTTKRCIEKYEIEVEAVLECVEF